MNVVIQRFFCAVFSVMLVACAARVVDAPETMPQLHKRYDVKKKQIFVRKGHPEEVVYTNYTDQELESALKGEPVRVDLPAVRLIPFRDEQDSEHLLHPALKFLLLHDDNRHNIIDTTE